MKLGEVVQITIGVSVLERSLSFYEKLGFQKIDQNKSPYPWAQLSDGQNLVLLNQDGNIYCGLTYFAADTADRVAQMEKMGIQFQQKQAQDGRLFMAIFTGKDGLAVWRKPVSLCRRSLTAVASPDTLLPLCKRNEKQK